MKYYFVGHQIEVKDHKNNFKKISKDMLYTSGDIYAAHRKSDGSVKEFNGVYTETIVCKSYEDALRVAKYKKEASIRETYDCPIIEIRTDKTGIPVTLELYGKKLNAVQIFLAEPSKDYQILSGSLSHFKKIPKS